jgi:hypothetical protein
MSDLILAWHIQKIELFSGNGFVSNSAALNGYYSTQFIYFLYVQNVITYLYKVTVSLSQVIVSVSGFYRCISDCILIALLTCDKKTEG